MLRRGQRICSTCNRWYSAISGGTRISTNDRLSELVSLIRGHAPGKPLGNSGEKEIMDFVDSLGPDYTSIKILKTALKNSSMYNGLTLRNKGIFEKSRDRSLAWLMLYKNVDKIEYNFFKSQLFKTIANGDLSTHDKFKRLYEIIRCQAQVFPCSRDSASLFIPEPIHKWFYDYLPPDELVSHYLFLISCDVNLSSSESINQLTFKMMQSSEIERSTATFEIFLNDPAKRRTFEDKFVKLHNFETMILIVNAVVRRDHWKHLEVYLSALVEKIKMNRDFNVNVNSGKLRYFFVRFLNELLFIVLKKGDTPLVAATFAAVVESIKKETGVSTISLLNKPILQLLNRLRREDAQDEIFSLVSVLNSLPYQKKSYNLNKRLITELATSLRSFNDPKLTCQFMCSSIQDPDIAQLFNSLGLWGWIWHNDGILLDSNQLSFEVSNLKPLLSQQFKIKTNELQPYLNEMYYILLKTYSTILPQSTYKEFILDLYSKYVAVLTKRYKTYHFYMHDTGVLLLLLKSTIYGLKDWKLAYSMLMDFYSHDFVDKIRNTSRECPFSLVIYSSSQVVLSEIVPLLSIMERRQMPLTFKICTKMVLEFLREKRVKEAEYWYQKIIHGQFDVRHKPLIEAIKSNGWEFPPNFDKTLLTQLDDDHELIGGTLENSDPVEKSLFLQDGESNDESYQTIFELLASFEKPLDINVQEQG
ncbi:Atp22p KNAG_0C05120 [Huiozyma naganishii CBS 8797]|uniref:Uncharacterized protein n=1 Tax=Huiozyma naganishii (strain ATCC MYA-139 / BCRC 22969 / CBS 8797 / KCTC 17520 / NBRC 10181 / NCYC 3082 / Yp74L-3) TaxID=1071383 RepID=J7RJB4_HUIN7|nr:hypothetical protein KNAG_0C05120 [Kazachstania naganishii CBS 8797]CCK69613.1 hypothetical protein KNAG_0C05120 [Kazachstania naganishii CBS 8797]